MVPAQMKTICSVNIYLTPNVVQEYKDEKRAYSNSLGEEIGTYVLRVTLKNNCALLFCLFGILVYQDIHLLGVIGGGNDQNLLRKDHGNIRFLSLKNKIEEHNYNHTHWAIFLRRDLLNIFFFPVGKSTKGGEKLLYW